MGQELVPVPPSQIAELAILVAGLLSLRALARWMGGGPGPSPSRRGLPAAALPTLLQVAAAAVLAVGLALFGRVTAVPAYWTAAAVAGICSLAAISVGAEVGAAFAGVGYALPSIRRVEAGAPGSVSAEGMLAAAGAATLLAALAQGMALIGPGDAGLILLAALASRLLERWLCGALGPGVTARWLAIFTPAATGTGLAAALVVLLP